MTCNYCDVGEIEYDRDTKKAYNLDGSDHIHPKKEGGTKKNFTKKEAQPIEGELILLGKISNVEASVGNLKETVSKLEESLKDAWEVIAKNSMKDGKGNKV